MVGPGSAFGTVGAFEQTGGRTLLEAASSSITATGADVRVTGGELAGIGSAAGAFDNPARSALIPTLVPREHLSNAISLGAIMFQIASVVGPAIGGIIIATLGVGWVYAINALTFVCVIAALLMMRAVPSRDTREPSDVSLRAVRDGLGFVFSSPIIRSTMLLDFFATFFASATALLPIFAQDVLHVGARGYGWLYAAPSVGAMVTSVVMIQVIERIERRGTPSMEHCGYVLRRSSSGISVVRLTSLHRDYGSRRYVIRCLRTHPQLDTPDHLRGRMTGVNMGFFMGGPQLGEWKRCRRAVDGARSSVVTGGIVAS